MENYNFYYVYELIDPVNGEVFYVGKGKGDRYKQHTYNRNKFPNRPVSKRIKSIMQQGLKVKHKFRYEELTEEQAFKREKEIIQEYGRVDENTGSLLNQTNGGDGWSNGRRWSNEYRQKRMEYIKDNPRGKPINQYSLKGEIIKTFPSANHAIREYGFNKGVATRIRQCCRGLANSANGFLWGYEGDPVPVFYKSTRKPVKQYTKKGEFVKEYESIQQAADITNINAGDIATMCRGEDRYKSVGGYVWRYAD